MTEEVNIPDLPSNSNASKKAKAREKLEPVVKTTAKRKKPSGWKQFKNEFVAEDLKTVCSYVFFDVTLPAIKNMCLDMANQTLERALFGTSNDRRPKKKRNYVSYSAYYRDRDDYAPSRKDISRRARTSHDFDEIIIDTREEAEEVLERLGDTIDMYDVATVSDLYDLVGITSEFTDDKWGWDDLRKASIHRVRQGYLLDLPRPFPID